MVSHNEFHEILQKRDGKQKSYNKRINVEKEKKNIQSTANN